MSSHQVEPGLVIRLRMIGPRIEWCHTCARPIRIDALYVCVARGASDPRANDTYCLDCWRAGVDVE